MLSVDRAVRESWALPFIRRKRDRYRQLYTEICSETESAILAQTERQRDKDRATDRETDRETETGTDRQTERKREKRERREKRDREKRETEKRETERDRETETERRERRKRERQRERDTQTERQTDRETEANAQARWLRIKFVVHFLLKVKMRVIPAPTFPWKSADLQSPQITRQRTDSATSQSGKDLGMRRTLPPYNQAREPYMDTESVPAYSRDMQGRPRDYNDPGTQRYRASSPLIGRPMYNAHSTPDLVTCYQGQPVDEPNHLSQARTYQRPASPSLLNAMDHNNSNIGERIFSSRSLTDLSNLPYEPSSPRPFDLRQRTSSLSEIGPVPLQTRQRYPMEAIRARSPLDWHDTVPRSLSDPVYTYGRPSPSRLAPYGFSPDVPLSPPSYRDGGFFSGRSSPAPIHPGDLQHISYTSYSQSPRARARGSFSRENELLQREGRDSSYSPNDHRFSSSLTDLRSTGISPPFNESYSHDAPRRQNVYSNENRITSPSDTCATERSTKELRIPNETRREKPSLNRARSCSEVEKEKRKSGSLNLLSHKRDSRDKYPLAQMPIPSFKEFKQRKQQNGEGARSSSNKESNAHDKDTKHTSDALSVKTTHAQVPSPSPTKEITLSSLYESVKDIGGQNTKEISESRRTSLRTVSALHKNSMESLSRARESSRALAKSLLEAKKSSDVRPNSYFTKNEVLHKLMMKYGLYDRNATTEENPKTTEDAAKTNASSNPRSRNHKDVPTAAQESDKAKSCDAVVQENPMGSPRGTQKSPVGSPRGTQMSPVGSPRGTQMSPVGSPRGTQKSDPATAPVLTNLLDKYKLLSAGKVKENVNVGKHSETQRIDAETDQKTKDKEVSKSSTQDESQVSVRNASRSGRLDSSMTEILKARLAAVRKKSAEKTNALNDDANHAKQRNSGGASSLDFYKTSKAVWCATKFRLNKNKSPSSSPNVERKGRETPDEEKTPKSAAEKIEDSTGKFAKEDGSHLSIGSCTPARLRKSGLHTSLLSLSSSVYSAEDMDMDDRLSLYSEADSQDSNRGRGRRWESFHSNVSADSGSAHLFEFDTESAVTEYGDVFDENEPLGKYIFIALTLRQKQRVQFSHFHCQRRI